VDLPYLGDWDHRVFVLRPTEKITKYRFALFLKIAWSFHEKYADLASVFFVYSE